jgi:hypothetical protein
MVEVLVDELVKERQPLSSRVAPHLQRQTHIVGGLRNVGECGRRDPDGQDLLGGDVGHGERWEDGRVARSVERAVCCCCCCDEKVLAEENSAATQDEVGRQAKGKGKPHRPAPPDQPAARARQIRGGAVQRGVPLLGLYTSLFMPPTHRRQFPAHVCQYSLRLIQCSLQGSHLLLLRALMARMRAL